jgi:hypothetical protein
MVLMLLGMEVVHPEGGLGGCGGVECQVLGNLHVVTSISLTMGPCRCSPVDPPTLSAAKVRR